MRTIHALLGPAAVVAITAMACKGENQASSPATAGCKDRVAADQAALRAWSDSIAPELPGEQLSRAELVAIDRAPSPRLAGLYIEIGQRIVVETEPMMEPPDGSPMLELPPPTDPPGDAPLVAIDRATPWARVQLVVGALARRGHRRVSLLFLSSRKTVGEVALAAMPALGDVLANARRGDAELGRACPGFEIDWTQPDATAVLDALSAALPTCRCDVDLRQIEAAVATLVPRTRVMVTLDLIEADPPQAFAADAPWSEVAPAILTAAARGPVGFEPPPPPPPPPPSRRW